MAEGEYPSERAELASRLVKGEVLTEYQARLVLKGKPQSLIFGGYVILDFLGKGTMGKVYKASHRMMDRIVALKILDPRYISVSTRSLARFKREMQLVGRLDHPNVVRAYDADRISDCHFIAMEYAEGVTLQDLLKARGALPPADVVYYASQAAEGLAHAHARAFCTATSSRRTSCLPRPGSSRCSTSGSAPCWTRTNSRPNLRPPG